MVWSSSSIFDPKPPLDNVLDYAEDIIIYSGSEMGLGKKPSGYDGGLFPIDPAKDRIGTLLVRTPSSAKVGEVLFHDAFNFLHQEPFVGARIGAEVDRPIYLDSYNYPWINL